jgi:transketolase
MRATRDWFGDALAELGAVHPQVAVVDCDLGSATKTGAFRDAFPDRYFQCGIAEANAIGVAAGLAQEGMRPFVASFGHFLTGKFLEIFQSVGLNDAAVVLVGTHAGLAIGKDGPTQMGLRDLALMRTLPNLEVLHPADGLETRQMVAYLAAHRRPAYLRLCRQPLEEVHDADYRFTPGRPDVVRDGKDVAVVTMGGMVRVVLDALPYLADTGLHPSVISLPSLPADPDALRAIGRAHQAVFVVEDHYVTGGIADEVARALVDLPSPPRFASRGVGDYGQAADPAELYVRYRLDSRSVSEHIRVLADSIPLGVSA